MAHQAYVAHYIPGRIRIRLRQAKRDHRLLQEIKQLLAPLPGVTEVHTYPATGSVVIHYQTEHHENFPSVLARHGSDSQLFALAPPVLTEIDEAARGLEAAAEFLGEHSRTAQSLVSWLHRLNDEVREATDNTLDLKVILPLGLAVYAYFKAESERSTPLWVTLGIFAFNSFVALHRPAPSIHLGDEHITLKSSPTALRKKHSVKGRTRRRG